MAPNHCNLLNHGHHAPAPALTADTAHLTLARGTPSGKSDRGARATTGQRAALSMVGARGLQREGPAINACEPAPPLGRRPERGPRADPTGDPQYAGHRGRLRESAGQGQDPDLPRRLLSGHPGLPVVAAIAARPLPERWPRVLRGQYSSGTTPRRDVARHGRRVRRGERAISGP